MVRQNRPASTIPIPCRLRCQTPLSYVFRSPCLKINILRLNAPKNAVANESFRGVYMQKILPIVYLNESKMPGIVYFPGLSPFAPHPKIKKIQDARNTNWVSDRGRPYAEEERKGSCESDRVLRTLWFEGFGWHVGASVKGFQDMLSLAELISLPCSSTSRRGGASFAFSCEGSSSLFLNQPPRSHSPTTYTAPFRV